MNDAQNNRLKLNRPPRRKAGFSYANMLFARYQALAICLVAITSLPRPSTSAMSTSPALTGALISSARIASITWKISALGHRPVQPHADQRRSAAQHAHRAGNRAHRADNLLRGIGLAALAQRAAQGSHAAVFIQHGGDLTAVGAYDTRQNTRLILVRHCTLTSISLSGAISAHGTFS